MNWGPQIEVWAKLEKELGLTKPKSGAEFWNGWRTGFRVFLELSPDFAALPKWSS